ncbi:hypothetical protein X566_24620 [Afipia sp. P52-10]|jgi:hypothetical protein|uniref:hypothetical protein n=1 Tax=Afipia sp. P52-10 TaxID=1429916 RepID=UPI0003DF13EE|nr:hypothetical protein [Afipia sp. P52-10]ETR75846.1 hypothetical protein X566_24620 [Afipia sp. P52-10]
MSTDFSVRPVGVPAAAALDRPAPEAARKAVPTQLPPAKSVTASEKARATRNDVSLDSERLSRQVIFDQDSAEIVYQVIDRRNDTVVHQVPDESKVRTRAYFREIDRSKELHRLQYTDRNA